MPVSRVGNNKSLPGIGNFLPGNAKIPLGNANSALGNAKSDPGIGNSEPGDRNSWPGKSNSDSGKRNSRLEKRLSEANMVEPNEDLAFGDSCFSSTELGASGFVLHASVSHAPKPWWLAGLHRHPWVPSIACYPCWNYK